MSTLTISPIPALRDNYIWVITHPAKHTCVIVDPGEAGPVLETLAQHQLTLVGIFITHHHWDHTDGISAIIARHPAPVFAPHSKNIPSTTHPLKEGDTVSLPDMELSYQIIETPAHTQDHISYYGHNSLFSGDTLFTGGCGRLFEGSAEQMCQSLDKLMALPDTTAIYCGHEYTEKNLQFAHLVEPNNHDIQHRLEQVHQHRLNNQPTVPATLEVEKKTNPFLRYRTANVKAAAETHAHTTFTNPVDVFAEIRRWKDTW